MRSIIPTAGSGTAPLPPTSAPDVFLNRASRHRSLRDSPCRAYRLHSAAGRHSTTIHSRRHPQAIIVIVAGHTDDRCGELPASMLKLPSPCRKCAIIATGCSTLSIGVVRICAKLKPDVEYLWLLEVEIAIQHFTIRRIGFPRKYRKCDSRRCEKALRCLA
jgi:hypothetical protein